MSVVTPDPSTTEWVPVWNLVGSIAVLPIRVVSADTVMTATDYTIVANGTPRNITLPAAPATGRIVNVKNGNTTTGQIVTVLGGSALIDVASSVNVGATASLSVQWDGTVWRIL